MTEIKPFEPIALAPDHYSVPSTGLSTEKGDSWLTVQQKINAGFQHVYGLIAGGVEHLVEAIDTKAREEIAELREELAAMQIKLDRAIGVAPNEGDAAVGGEGDPNAPPPPPPNPDEVDGFKAPGSDAA